MVRRSVFRRNHLPLFLLLSVLAIAQLTPATAAGNSTEVGVGADASACDGDPSTIQDDLCDVENNNEACGYDGGDCCPCDCDDSENWSVSCGDDGFACVDPSSDCVEEGVTADGCGDLTKKGDDACDVENNNEACGYDGGDCCPCDCDDSENWSVSCGDDGFACVDPSSDCVEEGVTADGCGDLTKKGDDACDVENNNEACGYDGGDCCPCDCDDTGNAAVSCGDDGFACVDPSSDCVEEGVTADGCGDLTKKGDDVCDVGNNNEACGYDGGDCCPCDCDDTGNDFVSCGDDGFACVDPSSDCVEEGVTADGCGDLTKKGDDVCDAENNNEACGYDGGDCCECDCDDTGNVLVSCGDNGFDCIDPSSECSSDVSGATYSLARSSFAANVCVVAIVAGLLLRTSLGKLL